MKLSGFSAVISTLFKDKMTISRYVDKENADGTTTTVLSDSPLFEDIPCRISFSSTKEKPNDNEIDDTPIEMMPRIFCGANVDIKAGDYIVITRYNDSGEVFATYAGKVGLPSVFITHKEALFSIERSA